MLYISFFVMPLYSMEEPLLLHDANREQEDYRFVQINNQTPEAIQVQSNQILELKGAKPLTLKQESTEWQTIESKQQTTLPCLFSYMKCEKGNTKSNTEKYTIHRNIIRAQFANKNINPDILSYNITTRSTYNNNMAVVICMADGSLYGRNKTLDKPLC